MSIQISQFIPPPTPAPSFPIVLLQTLSETLDKLFSPPGIIFPSIKEVLVTLHNLSESQFPQL